MLEFIVANGSAMPSPWHSIGPYLTVFDIDRTTPDDVKPCVIAGLNNRGTPSLLECRLPTDIQQF